MLASISQGLIALVLVSALLYGFFARLDPDTRKLEADLLLGAIFGLAGVSMLFSGYRLEDGVMLTAAPGLMLFAGFVGGPVAGATALVIVLATRIWIGGPFLPVAIPSNTAYLLAGLALRRVCQFTDWPRIPDGVLPYAFGGYLAIQAVCVSTAVMLGLIQQNVRETVAGFFLAGGASVVLAWLAVEIAGRQAAIARDNAVLMRQLKLIFDNCGIGAFRYDAKKGRLTYDESFMKLYEVGEDENLKLGELAARVVHPEDREEMIQLIRRSVAGDLDSLDHSFRAYRRNGQLRHMRAVWVADAEPGDSGYSVTGLHIDMTDVSTARAGRAAAEESIEAIAENVPGGIYESIWENGSPRELVYISPKCAEMWGLTQEDVMAKPYLLAAKQNPEEFERAVGVTRRAIETGEPGTTRLSVRGTDGDLRWLDFRMQAKPRDDGTHRVFGIFVDVTNEVEALEEAKKHAELAHRMQKIESIGELTGGVAHDFNNILAVVMGNLELLGDDVEDEEQKERIEAGIQACRRGADLTRSLLAFARRATLQPKPASLNVIAEQSKTWMRRAVPESIDLKLSLQDGLWLAKLDAASTESALLNLILNARDAMKGSGSLTIETKNVAIGETRMDVRNEPLPPGRYAMLAVSDTGPGIEGETLERMFEPFYTTKAPGEGSGVGLAMVIGFVSQSGGYVQVDTAPGEGATFRLYFPAIDAPADADAPALPSRSADASPRARVLLAEDDELLRATLVATLETAGHDVIAVETGDAALARFHDDPAFDLMITDSVMPGSLQGDDLARAVREARPDIPIIYLSGYAPVATAAGGEGRRLDIRIAKPAPKAELLDAVDAAMRARVQPA